MTFGEALRHAAEHGTIPAGLARIDGTLGCHHEHLWWNGPTIFRTEVNGVPALAWWVGDDDPVRRYLVVAHPDAHRLAASVDSWTWESGPLHALPATGWIDETQITYPSARAS